MDIKNTEFVNKRSDDNSFSLIGCKEKEEIKSYEDAEKMCPLIPKEMEKNVKEH